MQLLIQESCAFQEALVDTSYTGDLPHILIMEESEERAVGSPASSATGVILSAFMILPIPLSYFPSMESLRQGIFQASLILLATPIEATLRAYEELIALHPSAMICDNANLKSSLLQSIRKARTAHPRVASGQIAGFGAEDYLLGLQALAGTIKRQKVHG